MDSRAQATEARYSSPAPPKASDRTVKPSWTAATADGAANVRASAVGDDYSREKHRRDRDDEDQRPGDVFENREGDQQRDQPGEQETAVRRLLLTANHRRESCITGQAKSTRRAAPARAVVRR